ncbi:hypothetical protein NS220_12570 [Microbacterium testaceum]|uniref:Uncharacterized protein n=1 Tax=Microbacterium testaceum TaxID=2033 RepID=A0A147EV48_MICTE|nr:hypothetical protein NS220_12570 [Microbacterium testaceum]
MLIVAYPVAAKPPSVMFPSGSRTKRTETRPSPWGVRRSTRIPLSSVMTLSSHSPSFARITSYARRMPSSRACV